MSFSIERVSVTSGSAQGNLDSYNLGESSSADGRYVVFYSQASNLVACDTNATLDIFLRDTQTGTTTQLSRDSAGTVGNASSYDPGISADGRYVVLQAWGWGNVFNAGQGNNIVQGLADGGVNTVVLGNGNNTVAMTGFNNNITVGNGQNTIWLGDGNSTLKAGNGGNLVMAYGYSNVINTGSGNDNIAAGSFATVRAGGGDDQVWLGGGGGSTVEGGAGNDVITTGGGSADVLIGGTGNDQYVLYVNNAIIIENAAEGTDTIWSYANGVTLAANVEVGRVVGTATQMTGSADANVLVGNTAAAMGSVLDGGSGSDTIFGTAMADTLKGGLGDDVLYSYGGTDRYAYDQQVWGADQISGWMVGQKIDFTFSGLSFAHLAIQLGATDSIVTYAGSSIYVYNAQLTQSDFIFG